MDRAYLPDSFVVDSPSRCFAMIPTYGKRLVSVKPSVVNTMDSMMTERRGNAGLSVKAAGGVVIFLLLANYHTEGQHHIRHKGERAARKGGGQR